MAPRQQRTGVALPANDQERRGLARIDYCWLINHQTTRVLRGRYANAFYGAETKRGEWKSDRTNMEPGVHERKWEIDSLCYPIRMAHAYWKQTGDKAPFDE